MVEQQHFGTTEDGQDVLLYTLRGAGGAMARICSYGALVTEIRVPDRRGELANVVLGFDSLDGYLSDHPYFGATIGRVANRIAGAQFELDGKRYTLFANNGPHHLHGGKRGFDKKVWGSRPAEPLSDGAAVEFTYLSPDGEEGYPGNLRVVTRFSLNEKNELRIDYSASTDAPTPVNLTHHSYFNLAGGGDVLGHEASIQAARYTPSDSTLAPTGEVASVEGTPFDFRKPVAIGSRFGELKSDPLGYDHNFVLDHGGKELARAAEVYEPQSGRVLEALTTAPGLQFYTGNFLDGSLRGSDGRTFGRHSGFCLEAQGFPNAINEPRFPSIVLRPGETYQSATVYRFSTR